MPEALATDSVDSLQTLMRRRAQSPSPLQQDLRFVPLRPLKLRHDAGAAADCLAAGLQFFYRNFSHEPRPVPAHYYTHVRHTNLAP